MSAPAMCRIALLIANRFYGRDAKFGNCSAISMFLGGFQFLGQRFEFQRPDPILEKGDFISSSMAISDLEDHPIDAEFNHIFSLARKSNDQGSRVLDPNKPAATIRAECHGNNQFRYSQARRITMREAARFQSFPDDFKFMAKLRETERMIGNAVPPVLAWYVAQSVKNTLDRIFNAKAE